MRALPASTKAIPTPVLVNTTGNIERAELFWRISVPISALMLTLLAMPLSYVNPRVGRSFNLIAAAPKAGRSMVLFQDLSAAYALGKSLPDIEEEGTARRPESVVEPLMLSCL